MNLVRAELQKLFTTRLWWILALVMVAFVVLFVGLFAAFTGEPAANGGSVTPERSDPQFLIIAWINANTSSLFVMILGIILMTQEYRYQTITGTFLATPRRGRVIVGKLAAGAILGVLFALLALVAVAAISLPIYLIAGGDLAEVAGDLGLIGLGLLLVSALYGLFGIALGALIRNQIAAIVTALVWVLVVENVLTAIPQLQTVAKWLPGGAAGAAQQIGELDTAFGGQPNLLPAWGGALVLIGYAILFAVVANVTTVKRDIT